MGIADVDAEPVPLRADGASPPALDIKLAVTRGVSPVHLQYVRNMDVKSTLTLSIVLDGKLWGMISFHHQRPRAVSPRVRQVLTSFLKTFCLKLSLLQGAAALSRERRVDALQASIQAKLEAHRSLEHLLDDVGPAICQILDVQGLAMLTGSQTIAHGEVPDQAVLAALAKDARAQPSRSLVTDNLVETYPGLAEHLNGSAGALVSSYPNDRALYAFRVETERTISWAGNPEKRIERVEGNLRLHPRGSFATYLEHVRGRSKPWAESDLYLMRQIWPLLSASERRVFAEEMTRKRRQIVDELNHRVRNILAMVRSVSQLARNFSSSSDNFAAALDSRIQALADAHDLGSGTAGTSVSVSDLILTEAEPLLASGSNPVLLHGEDFGIHADFAPMLALVLHELVTNAAEHGALSSKDGHVTVRLSTAPETATLEWTEREGPTVTEPGAQGFGTRLILQAIQQEIGGTAELFFEPEGLRAVLGIPRRCVDPASTSIGTSKAPGSSE